jgi:hypothetical protein
MESITRNISDIAPADRHALEHVIGQRLSENQRVIIQVMTVGGESPNAAAQSAQSTVAGDLPAWCHVYDGLSDEEIEEIEAVILDRDHWARHSA